MRNRFNRAPSWAIPPNSVVLPDSFCIIAYLRKMSIPFFYFSKNIGAPKNWSDLLQIFSNNQSQHIAHVQPQPVHVCTVAHRQNVTQIKKWEIVLKTACFSGRRTRTHRSIIVLRTVVAASLYMRQLDAVVKFSSRFYPFLTKNPFVFHRRTFFLWQTYS